MIFYEVAEVIALVPSDHSHLVLSFRTTIANIHIPEVWFSVRSLCFNVVTFVNLVKSLADLKC